MPAYAGRVVTRSLSGEAIAPQEVFSAGYQYEMGWFHTPRMVAAVINNDVGPPSIWEKTFGIFKGHSWRQKILTVQIEFAIATSIPRAAPFPAIAPRIYLQPKASRGGKTRPAIVWHRRNLPRLIGPYKQPAYLASPQ